MSWSEIGEFVKAVAPGFTAAAACTAAWIGWHGLEKWRSETLGKRKAEIAETTLASVYEMEEILRLARSPWVQPHETAKKEGLPDEVATDPNYAPEARLLEHQEFFGRFRTQKFAFAAVFGRDAAQALDGLWQCRLEINRAVDNLLRNKEMSPRNRDMRTIDAEDRAAWEEWYYTAFRPMRGNDALVGKRISEYVSAIEATCRPAIEARANP